MLIQLNFKSGLPVYLQIAEQIRAAAASGALRAGEPLPGIRPLAEQLRINRNTVAKAYSEKKLFPQDGGAAVKDIEYTIKFFEDGGSLLKLQALSLQGLYRQIRIPLLVINGDRDTLLSTQDSVDLAEGAPQATLKLYPQDDHCAMGHYREWLDLSQAWLKEHLTTPQGASHALASPDLT